MSDINKVTPCPERGGTMFADLSAGKLFSYRNGGAIYMVTEEDDYPGKKAVSLASGKVYTPYDNTLVETYTSVNVTTYP